EKLAQPRRSGDRAALRVLLASRSLTDQQRTANKNALTALLRITDVGIDARKPLTDAQIATIAAWRTGRDERSQRDFRDRKSTRLYSSHASISYAVFCFKKIRGIR